MQQMQFLPTNIVQNSRPNVDDATTEEIAGPCQISEGWIAEEEGVRHWPPTLYPQMFTAFCLSIQVNWQAKICQTAGPQRGTQLLGKGIAKTPDC